MTGSPARPPLAGARRALLFLLLLVLALPMGGASCGHDRDPGPPGIIPPLGAQVVAFAGNEGALLGGTLMRNRESQRAVICLHMWDGNASDYDPLLPEVARRGFNVLAFDLPGKRLSRGRETSRTGDPTAAERYRLRDKKFFEVMWVDVQAAQQYLVEVCGVDPRRIALVGAGIGSTIAQEAAIRDPRPPALVLLSPGRRYLGIDSAALIPLIGDLPILLMAPTRAVGEDDAIRLFTEQQEPKLSAVSVVQIDGDFDDAHGTRMLSRPSAVQRIADFLDAAVR